MIDINALKSQYAQLVTQAKAQAAPFAGKEADMPPETMTAINGLLGKADELKAKLDLAERLNAGEAYALEPGQAKAAGATWRAAGPDEGDEPVDTKSWREFKVQTALGEKTVRYNVPLSVEKKGYDRAFEAYCRKGFGDLGPQDRKFLSESVDSAGGFLVPPDYHAELLRKITVQCVVRQYARIVQTSRDVAQFPKVTWTTDDLYSSGVKLTWTGEAPAASTTARVTDPVFGLVSIPVNTAMASMPLYNDMIEDAAFDVLGISQDLFAESFAAGEENVYINGTGVAQPMGLVTQVDVSGVGISSVVSGATASPYFTAVGLINLESGLPPQYERNAVFLGKKATYNYIRQIVSTTSGDPWWPVFQQYGGLGERPATLLGYPVVKSEFMPSAVTSNNYALLLGDLSGYFIAERVGFSVQRLSELYAETNVTLLLARRRVGGQPAQPWRMRISKTST
jgi:HK97 family phage major capsid protein